MIEAANDFIILEQETKTDDGLYRAPGEVSEMKYKVLSIGGDVKACDKGDIVVAFVEPPIKIDGKDYWYTKDESVIGLVK